MPEECIELLVANLFLVPAPFTPPTSPLSGFLRFLKLLSTHDWKTVPIVVNLNNNLSAEEHQEISSRFMHNRTQLPPLFISTPKDKFVSVWTKDKPTKLILNRMVALARGSLSVLEQQLSMAATQDVDFKQIFRPPLSDYDVIITLHRHFVPRHSEAIDCRKPPAVSNPHRQASVVPVVDFDPVCSYITDLKESFNDVALFFYDSSGGDTIGVVWKPPAFVPSQFKVLHAEWKAPVTKASSSLKAKTTQQMVVPNTPAILSDFYTLGEGLVKNIEVVNSCM